MTDTPGLCCWARRPDLCSVVANFVGLRQMAVMDQLPRRPYETIESAEKESARRGVRVIPAIMAVFATVAVLLLALVSAVVLVQMLQAQTGWMTVERGGVIALALMQTLLILLTLFVAWLRGTLSETLALRWPTAGELRAIAGPTLIMFVVLALYTVAAFWLTPELIKEDLGSFRPLLATDVWWVAVAAVALGAPVSEELLFRGFLLGELMAARLATAAAVLIPNVLWTALHYEYSAVGLGEVFLAGLLLSWTRLRSGSVVVPIGLHMIYNVIALAIMFAVLD